MDQLIPSVYLLDDDAPTEVTLARLTKQEVIGVIDRMRSHFTTTLSLLNTITN